MSSAVVHNQPLATRLCVVKPAQLIAGVETLRLSSSLGHFQVGSCRFWEPYRRSIYLIEALWKPYIP